MFIHCNCYVYFSVFLQFCLLCMLCFSTSKLMDKRIRVMSVNSPSGERRIYFSREKPKENFELKWKPDLSKRRDCT